ncbi:MAG: tRNA (guanosine(37)-N1)-methyltransferase TrmD [Deltaproteobacteria bacterium]|nr:tRNA (guanosine(37)-N1)-methyltransferase TrmD [Deltaproteobacteria bacterium]
MSNLQFDILTIFPEFFDSCRGISLFGKALKEKKFALNIHNIRDFTHDKHHKVDDEPFGGGAGMVMKPEPLVEAIESVRLGSVTRGSMTLPKKSRTILMTPRGALFTQSKAKELAECEQIILICGRYEGVDERVSELAVDEELSIGDYILNGGEAASLVVMDCVARLLPGVVGNASSLADESHTDGLLEYPQYTRPAEFRGLKVPEVLASGDHKKIVQWRRQQAEEITKKRRPDLIPLAKKSKTR